MRASGPSPHPTENCGLSLFALWLALGPATAQETAQQRLQRAIGLPVPSGPYASWPKQDRDQIVRTLFQRCASDNASSFGRGYQGPDDAYQQSWQAETFACVVRKIPSDWPLLAQARRAAQTHYEAARAIDPKVPSLDLPDW
jgi:hypothetical protein